MDTIPPSIPTAKNSSLATWSLVLGILSIVLLPVCIGLAFAIPAVICGHIAHGRIKRSGGALKGPSLAGLITGYVSLGLAFFIIPLMAAIAIPNFVKARDTAQKNICIINLRKIDAAKQQWAMDNGKGETNTPTAQDLEKYIPDGFSALHCPKDGVYTINQVNEPPTCSVPGHQLPKAP